MSDRSFVLAHSGPNRSAARAPYLVRASSTRGSVSVTGSPSATAKKGGRQRTHPPEGAPRARTRHSLARIHRWIAREEPRNKRQVPSFLRRWGRFKKPSLTKPFATERDATETRLIVRRVRPTPGSQLALLTLYSYHAFITDREGSTRMLEADHRRHAEVENAIRDLKYGVGLNHLPSGRFGANAAWLALQVIAHNLARWTARLGLAEKLLATKTLRRRFFSLPGRLARSARRLRLHLPGHWPWAEQFLAALSRLRAITTPLCS